MREGGEGGREGKQKKKKINYDGVIGGRGVSLRDEEENLGERVVE